MNLLYKKLKAEFEKLEDADVERGMTEEENARYDVLSKELLNFDEVEEGEL